jgi:hypothetical protein
MATLDKEALGETGFLEETDAKTVSMLEDGSLVLHGEPSNQCSTSEEIGPAERALIRADVKLFATELAIHPISKKWKPALRENGSFSLYPRHRGTENCTLDLERVRRKVEEDELHVAFMELCRISP